MSQHTSFLEHVNFSVSDAIGLAQQLCVLLDWSIRWQGESIHQGYTVHVGNADSYLALYQPPQTPSPKAPTYVSEQALNHIGIVTHDLETIRERVLEHGLTVHNENSFPPGKRIYFMLRGIEFEVVEY